MVSDAATTEEMVFLPLRSAPPESTGTQRLPLLRARSGDLASYMSGMLDQLRADSLVSYDEANPIPPPGMTTDWLVALTLGWATIAEITSFYMDRVLNQSFVGTSSSHRAADLIAHSLGYPVAVPVMAKTLLSYEVRANAAGVRHVARNRRLGSGAGAASGTRRPPMADPASLTGSRTRPGKGNPPSPSSSHDGDPHPASVGSSTHIPAAARARAVGDGTSSPPAYTTTASLTAHTSAAAASVAPAPPPRPLPIIGSVTQLEVEGTSTRLQPGMPLVVSGQRANGKSASWIRTLTDVIVNKARGVTRLTWAEPLDASQPSTRLIENPSVEGFLTPHGLFGADASRWSSLKPSAQFAVAPSAVPVGGVATSSDLVSWESAPPGLPVPSQPSAVLTTATSMVVAFADRGVWRSVGGGPFVSTGSGPLGTGVVSLTSGSGRLLAGSKANGVYQSLDDGASWSALRGGPPSIGRTSPPKRLVSGIGRVARVARDAAGAAISAAIPAAGNEIADIATGDGDSSTPTDGSKKVVANQLPPIPIRAVGIDPQKGHVWAGTDRGLYGFDGTNWRPDAALTVGVFALAPDGRDTIYAATEHGVWSALNGTWSTHGTGLTERTVGVTVDPDGGLWAITHDSIWRNAGAGAWTKVVGPTPPDGEPQPQLRALVRSGGTTVIATNAGVWARADWELVWARIDTIKLFRASLKAAGVTDGGLSNELRLAFDGAGFPLTAAATVQRDDDHFEVADGDAHYQLNPVTGTAHDLDVMQANALANAMTLAVDERGHVSVGAPATGIRPHEWPGFGVHGSQIRLNQKDTKIEAGTTVVLDPGDGPGLRLLSVSETTDAAVSGYGSSATVTDLVVSPPIDPGVAGRRTATLWSQPVPVTLALPDFPTPTVLSGATIHLQDPLNIPACQGRDLVVTGQAPALARIVRSGAARLVGSEAIEVGPAGAVVVDLASGPDAEAYAATDEGVFELSVSDGAAKLLDESWPGGPAAAVAVADGSVLAATGSGVYVIATGSTSARWRSGGLREPVRDLACAGAVAWVLTEKSAVLRTTITASDQSPIWAGVASVPGAELIVASESSAWVWDGAALLHVDDAGLSDMPALSAPPRLLAVDGDETLWAVTDDDVLTLPSGAQAWRPMTLPSHATTVEALAIRGTTVVLVTGDSTLTRSGDTWTVTLIGGLVGSQCAALGSDGAVWVGAGGQSSRPTVDLPVTVSPSDVAALDAGALPLALADALHANGQPIDAAASAIESRQNGQLWLLWTGTGVMSIALRRTRTSMQLAIRSVPALGWLVGPRDRHGRVKVKIGDRTEKVAVAERDTVVLPASDASPHLAEPCSIALAEGTSVGLAEPLSHTYDLSTVKLHLNVVTASQGLERSAVLGSGDPTKAYQSFEIPTPVGTHTPQTLTKPAVGSLTVTVDGAPWKQIASLSKAGANDAVYVERTGHAGKVTVCFGDGVHGRRLPKGHDNVAATWLDGGGAGGDVAAGQIAQVLDRPQLVVGVSNPVPATRPPSPEIGRLSAAMARCLGRATTLNDLATAARAEAGVVAACADLVAIRSRRVAVVSLVAEHGLSAVQTRVSESLATMVGPETIVKTMPAEPVGVRVHLLVAVSPLATTSSDDARAVVVGLRPTQPGAAITSARIVEAVAELSGVVSVSVIRLQRVDRTQSRADAVVGRAARSDAGTLRGAEFLSFDAADVEIEMVEARHR